MSSARDIETLRDRQEVVRIRLEHMLTQADPRTLRVLNLALHKCNAKLDSLASSTRPVEDARARMRVIESKHFHGATAASRVPPELRALHIRRGGVATLVEHVQCALYDQVRIHYLLAELAAKLASLRALLHTVDRPDRHLQSDQPRYDRADDLNAYHHPQSRNMTQANNPGHSMQSTSSQTQPRASFSGDTLRRSAFNRRVSRSSTTRMDSEDIHIRDPRQPSLSSGPSHLRSQRSLPRRIDSKLIPFVVKRALSYNSSPLGYSDQANVGEQPIWWRSDSPATTITSRLPKVTSSPQVNSDASAFNTDGAVGDRNDSRLGAMNSGIIPFGPATPARSEDGSEQEQLLPAANELSGTIARLVESVGVHHGISRGTIDDAESGDEDSFPVSPVSYSTGSENLLHQNETVGGLRIGEGIEVPITQDIDTLWTEASSVLSSSRGTDAAGVDKALRRGSLTAGLMQQGSGSDSRNGSRRLHRLRFGRMRVHSQMKRLWGEVNELYGVVLTHGPHLVEENIVSRDSMETGLLGSWNVGKGLGNGVRASFQAGVVREAIRKVDGIVTWQHRLVVAIRRDFYEQRKSLRQLDHVIRQAYLASLETGKGK